MTPDIIYKVSVLYQFMFSNLLFKFNCNLNTKYILPDFSILKRLLIFVSYSFAK